MLLIKNGLIHDAVNREPYIADILVDEGKIVKMEKDIEAEGAQVQKKRQLDLYIFSSLYPLFHLIVLYALETFVQDPAHVC